MRIKLELTGAKEAENKIKRFIQAAKENVKPVIASVIDGEGDNSAYALMMANLKAIVYDVYIPVIYQRKGMLGGLAGAIKTEYDGEYEARVYIDGDALADDRLADGDPYFWRVLEGHGSRPYEHPKDGAAFMKPRDFYTPTVEAVRRNIESGSFKQNLIKAINAAKAV